MEAESLPPPPSARAAGPSNQDPTPARPSKFWRAIKRLLMLGVVAAALWGILGPSIKFFYWQYMLTSRSDPVAARHLLLDVPDGRGAALLGETFKRSTDPKTRHAVVWAWTEDRDLISLYNLFLATDDPDESVRDLALAGLELRVVESTQFAGSLAGDISLAKGDPTTQQRLARMLEVLSYGAFAMPSDAPPDAVALAARSWADTSRDWRRWRPEGSFEVGPPRLQAGHAQSRPN